jgi:hypothetical protein
VVKAATIRVVLQVAASLRLCLRQADVSSAFLHSPLDPDEHIYLKVPDGLSVPSGSVLKLKKSLYGLKQAPKKWNSTIDTYLKEYGFMNSMYDACLYYKYDSVTGSFTILANFVDDNDIRMSELRRRFRLSPAIQRIWSLISILVVLVAISLFTVASSTAVDRLALYLIPIQLFVGSRLPDTRLFGLAPASWTQILIAFSLAVLLVWLIFAVHAQAWLPYRNLLLPF